MRVVVKKPTEQYTEPNGEETLDEILLMLKHFLSNDIPTDFVIRRNGIGCNELRWGNISYIFIVED